MLSGCWELTRCFGTLVDRVLERQNLVELGEVELMPQTSTPASATRPVGLT